MRPKVKYLKEFVSAQFKKQDIYLTELDLPIYYTIRVLFNNLCPTSSDFYFFRSNFVIQL